MRTALTPAHIQAKVRSLREKRPDAEVIGIRSQGPWGGPTRIQVGDEEFEIAACRSVLEVREKLALHKPGSPGLILLTGLSDSDLGEDVLARLAKRRLLSVESWEIVKDLFAAREVDPRLARMSWMANALLATAPAGGYPAVGSGVLDRETVWGLLLEHHLLFENARPDAVALLRWTTAAESLARYQSAPAEMRGALGEWIVETAGDVGGYVVAMLESGHGADALPVGIACGVVFHENGRNQVPVAQAAVRLERYVGGQTIRPEIGRRWAAAAGQVLRSLRATEGTDAARRWLSRADKILDEIQAAGFAEWSDLALAGFDARLERYGKELAAALSSRTKELPAPLAEAAEAVRAHDQASFQPDPVRRVEMSMRLARWCMGEAGRTTPAGSLPEATRAYARHGAFVDWARSALRGGEHLGALSAAYGLLLERVGQLREAENRRFGELLAGWTSSVSRNDGLIPIEDVLTRIVAPLAKSGPVLLIVLDGMSCAVFHELVADVTRRGWVSLGAGSTSDGGANPLASQLVLAALPTVTEVCRTSLLTGQLGTGTSSTEKTGFSSHLALRAASKAKHPPVLFHKLELTDSGQSDLAPEIRTELASADRQVVGVVLNAVDDHLLKSDQVRMRWNVDLIELLGPLLYEAQAADRVVVLTSDHGHVFEADTGFRKSEPGERWRMDDGKPQADEVVLEGPRVVSALGPRIIAPWSERVRYGAKKNGYHGGASPQEAVVPLAVLKPATGRLDLPGWAEAAPSEPDWWLGLGSAPEAGVMAAKPKGGGRSKKITGSVPQGDLFESATPVPVRPAASEAWVEALFRSAVFVAQKQAVGRTPLPDDRVRECLVALDRQGGKLTTAALTVRLGIPPVRIRGFLASMQRLLNVEGYDVLAVDDASDTVTLDRGLLAIQFELKS